MFGLGFMEIMLLTLIAFLVFGPKQFPLVAKNFIKFLNELKRAFTEVKSEFYDVQTETQKHVQQITDDIGKSFPLARDFQPEKFFLNPTHPAKKSATKEQNKDKNLDPSLEKKKEDS